MSGSLGAAVDKRLVREATTQDIDACEQLCARIHGFARAHEIRAAVAQKRALVVLHERIITGYSTGLGLLCHAVGETTDDVTALIAAAPSITGPGFFVPVRNGRLMRWLLGNRYRAVWQATLMSSGAYQEPAGAFLPSIAY